MDRSKFRMLSTLGQIGIWSFLFMVFFIEEILYEELSKALLSSFMDVLSFIFAVYVHYFFLIPLLNKNKRWLYLLLTLALIAGSVLLNFRISALIPSEYGYDYKFEELYWYFYYFILSTIIVAVSGLYYFAEAWIENLEKESILKTEKLQAELNFLKSQINPHFLFNTLNNIYAFAQTGNEHTAPMIERLASILRFIVYDCQGEEVALQKELQAIEDMLDLYRMKNSKQQNIRFEHKGVKGFHLISPLMLVNLVENAFKHSDALYNKDGFIDIKLKVNEQDHCSLEIRNSVKPMREKPVQEGGLGLQNLRKRLEIQHQGAYTLNEKFSPDTYYLELMLPLSRKN